VCTVLNSHTICDIGKKHSRSHYSSPKHSMPGVAGGCNPNSVGVKLRSSQSETPPTHTHKLSSLSFLTKKFHHLKPLGKANVESQTTTRVLLQVHPWKSERQLASYVTIRLFASLSCRQGRAGMAGSSCRALGSNKN
jgi:hypothetical protein